MLSVCWGDTLVSCFGGAVFTGLVGFRPFFKFLGCGDVVCHSAVGGVERFGAGDVGIWDVWSTFQYI